jgi:hypothetical protein
VVPRSVADLYAAQQRRTAAAILAARGEWSKLSKPDDFGRIANRLLALVMSAQLGSARDGAAMVPAALAETGYPERSLARVNPSAFAGWASDGRSLESLLWLTPSIAQDAGMQIPVQMAAGQNFLDLLLQRQISDAGRGAAGVAITATRNTGWVRYVNPPCCQRCAILAGRVYRFSHGFQRHFRCDCQMRPVSDREPPDGYTETVSLDQIHDLTDAQRRAVEDGADLNQVVNAYRERMSGRDKMMTTTEGTTRRGWASHVRRSIDTERGTATVETVARSHGTRNVARTPRRLTPEAIYQQAGDDRQKAIRLLTENGYLVGDLRSLARSVA